MLSSLLPQYPFTAGILVPPRVTVPSRASLLSICAPLSHASAAMVAAGLGGLCAHSGGLNHSYRGWSGGLGVPLGLHLQHQPSSISALLQLLLAANSGHHIGGGLSNDGDGSSAL
jgi:hypothetical protein